MATRKIKKLLVTSKIRNLSVWDLTLTSSKISVVAKFNESIHSITLAQNKGTIKLVNLQKLKLHYATFWYMRCSYSQIASRRLVNTRIRPPGDKKKFGTALIWQSWTAVAVVIVEIDFLIWMSACALYTVQFAVLDVRKLTSPRHITMKYLRLDFQDFKKPDKVCLFPQGNSQKHCRTEKRSQIPTCL